MGVLDKIRGEFVDIIEWLDDTNTTLAWRFPRYNNEIKNGAELIVREGQRAVFVYRGQLADRFDPGHYTLTTESLPVMSTLRGWQHGFNSPFRSEVYFISTRPVTDMRWGTPQPVTVRDPDFGMVPVRANGTIIIRVTDPDAFLRQVIGTESIVDADQLTELIRRHIAVAFNDMVLASGLGAIDLQGRQVELSEQLREFVGPRVRSYGLGIDAVTMTVSLPTEIRQAMVAGVARGVAEGGFLRTVGDLNRYTQARAADALLAAAQNPNGGVAGAAAQAGLGLAVGAQLAGAAQTGYTAAQQPPPVPPPLPPQHEIFHIEQSGQATGPFPLDELRRLAGDGRLTATTRVWAAGMADWAAAATVPALQALFDVPPPLPPR